MHFQIVSARTGRVRQFDLTENRTLMIGAAATLLLVTAIFFSGIQLGRFIAGPLQGEQLARELQEQRMAIDGARVIVAWTDVTAGRALGVRLAELR